MLSHSPFLTAGCALALLSFCSAARAEEPRILVADTFEPNGNGGPLKGRRASQGDVVWNTLGNATVTAAGTLTSGGADGGTGTIPIPSAGGVLGLSADVNSTKSGFVALTFMERGDVKFWNDATLWVAAYPSGKLEFRAKNMETMLYTADPAPGWKKGEANRLEIRYDSTAGTAALRLNGNALVSDKALGFRPALAFAGFRFHPKLDGQSAMIDSFKVTATGAASAPAAPASGVKDIPVLKPQANYPPPTEPIDTLTGAPVWASDTITNEPLVFIDGGDGKPVAKLLFEPQEILSIRSANLSTTYQAGRDITLPAAGSRELSLPQGSAVPFLKLEELFPPAGAPDAIRAAQGDRAAKFGANRFMRWAENPRAFLLRQVVVTYRHSGKWTGFRPQFAGEELKRTLTKLKAKEPLKIAVIGDSISAGGSASVTVRQPPMLPPYDRLMLDKLRKQYGGDIQLVNLAKGGQVTEWALTQIPLIIDQKPDLLIVAFGMNDGSGRIKPERFGDAHRKLLDGVRAGLPNVDVIFVSPIHGNPEWTGSAPDLYPKYLETLKGFRGPGLAVADVTTPFGEMLALKSYADLTVNGVNHPNDFGHRLYADVISALLVE